MVARHDGTRSVLGLLRVPLVIRAEHRGNEEKAGNRQSSRSPHGVLHLADQAGFKGNGSARRKQACFWRRRAGLVTELKGVHETRDRRDVLPGLFVAAHQRGGNVEWSTLRWI